MMQFKDYHRRYFDAMSVVTLHAENRRCRTAQHTEPRAHPQSLTLSMGGGHSSQPGAAHNSSE
jgi:hypothetical protein